MGIMRTILQKVYYQLFRADLLSELKKRGLVCGKNLRMHEGVIIDLNHAWHTTIGDDVTLAPRVHVLAHDGSTMKFINHTKIGKVTIGNHVFIGASSIIMPGVTIGNNVIIGVGSIVTHDIPDNQVAAGNPARVICSLEEFTAKHEQKLKLYPIFSYDYTVTRNITNEMQDEMNEKMKDRYGYIARHNSSSAES